MSRESRVCSDTAAVPEADREPAAQICSAPQGSLTRPFCGCQRLADNQAFCAASAVGIRGRTAKSGDHLLFQEIRESKSSPPPSPARCCISNAPSRVIAAGR
jgi:hypothetical protein